ncbi:MAG: hypothetical protein U0T83_08460 [Bacteriovoracaceae bacterium]
MLNLFTFRSVYQTQDSIQVDAIRVTPFSNNFFYWEGDRVPKLTFSSLMLEANPKRNEDLKVIDWFQDAYLTGKTCTIDNQEAFASSIFVMVSLSTQLKVSGAPTIYPTKMVISKKFLETQ